MKRFLAVAALTALPLTAEATVGFTVHQGAIMESRGFGISPMNWVPSVDFYPKGWVVQVDALETLASITRKEVDGDGDKVSGFHVGINAYKKNKSDNGKVSENINGVWQWGTSFDIDANTGFDPVDLYAMLCARVGAQSVKKFGFGMYVVPALGFAMVPDLVDDPTEQTFGLAYGGHLQVSAWSKKK